MIYDIGEILKELIEAENLPYVETLAGVVQLETAEKMGKEKGTTVEKSFPIYCPQKEDCPPNGKIQPLVPSKERKSLFYFERNGDVIFNGRDKKYSQFTADLLLTGWLNPKKLGSDDCSITARITAKLLRTFDKGFFNALGKYSKIRIKPISIKTKEPSIFQKYKYSKKFYHLLEFPYDYFQIRIQVDFSVHDNCLDDFDTNPEIIC